MHTKLSPLRKNEVVIGKPLPWPVYDRSRKLRLREGFVVESIGQIERLIQEGLFRPSNGSVTGGYAAIGRPDDGAEPHPSDANKHAGHNSTPSVTIANSKFDVGMAIQVSSLSAPDERNVVKLVGFLDKQSIIVTHPLKDGVVAFIKEGTEYHCRAFQKRNAYSFDVVVLRSQLTPFPYLHLSYPTNIAAVPVRKASRIPVEIIASVGPQGRRARVPCVVRDLSLSGVLIQSTALLGEKIEYLTIAFRLAVDEAPTLFEIDLVIRNNMTSENEKNKGIYRTGCEFYHIDPDLKRLLELYIYRELAQEA